MIDPDRILFIPSIRRGNGTGHLKRCLDWGADLPVQHLYSLDSGECIDIPGLNRKNIRWHRHPGKRWDLIFLDNRNTKKLPDDFKGIPVIAVDESGKVRSCASYSLDILPNLNNEKPNLRNFNFLSFPVNKRNRSGIKNILVTFGGEDSASLGTKVLNCLSGEMLNRYKWTFVLPGTSVSVPSGKPVECLNYIEDLRENLWKYDLIVTSYGLTAFESLSADVNVILLNPGSYHDRLSRKSEFQFLKNGFKQSPGNIRKFINGYLELYEQKTLYPDDSLEQPQIRKQEKITDWISSMNVSKDLCPVCGSSRRKSIGRFPGKSYFICCGCRMTYMVQFRQKSEIYNKEYFFSEYKAQYGRTYLEDFPHIQSMAEERLRRIGRHTGRILDVGCAYGPFLLKAHSWGLIPWGLEISEDAVEYVKEKFPHLNIRNGAFQKIKDDMFENEFFDIITFWYVIEHFQDLKTVLSRAKKLLKTGGVLALSTPHARGVSGLFNNKSFLSSSPDDHFTLWDRNSAKRALKLYGFNNVRFHITGHHPERFPAFIKKLFPRSWLLFLSKSAGLGDTFEIYAEKG